MKISMVLSKDRKTITGIHHSLMDNITGDRTANRVSDVEFDPNKQVWYAEVNGERIAEDKFRQTVLNMERDILTKQLIGLEIGLRKQDAEPLPANINADGTKFKTEKS